MQNSHVITWEEQTVYQQEVCLHPKEHDHHQENTQIHTQSSHQLQEEITESEQELMSADDEARTPGKSSRNVNDKTVCWKFFYRSTKRYFWFKNIFGYFCCSKWEFLGFKFRTIERKTQCPFSKQMLTARDKKLKLSGKSLTEHLRRKQGAHKDVGAA